jgi:adenylosuccinate lyase
MKRLGLQVAPVATQVLQRDRHAAFLTTLALIGATLEQMAVEIRNLQRTDVHEVEEPFAKGQKGSSAMPHKKNPIVSERVTGMARVLRGYAHTAMENVALWHERDISHSGAERIIFPDGCHLLHYMLNKMIWLIGGLEVFPERMLENMGRVKGMVFSQTVLLALVQAGVTREDAYAAVQRCAMRVWDEDIDFEDVLRGDAFVMETLGEKELARCFDFAHHQRNIDHIFARTLDGA